MLENIITLIVVGLVLWLIDKLPINQAIKGVINVLVIIMIIVWLVKEFGLLR